MIEINVRHIELIERTYLLETLPGNFLKKPFRVTSPEKLSRKTLQKNSSEKFSRETFSRINKTN